MTPESVLKVITELSSAKGAPKTIDPNMVARELAGPDSKNWGRMARLLRPVFVRLAQDGSIELIRKGKVADPAGLRGVYRLRLTHAVN